MRTARPTITRLAHPDDVAEIARRLRDYLRDHPDGRFAADARNYLEWWDKISVPGEYRVTLRRGEVEPSVGKYFSGGAPTWAWSSRSRVSCMALPRSSVTPTGPSGITRSLGPINWKLGDPITIRIIDYDWSASEVYTLNSRPGDPLAMRLFQGRSGPPRGARRRWSSRPTSPSRR